MKEVFEFLRKTEGGEAHIKAIEDVVHARNEAEKTVRTLNESAKQLEGVDVAGMLAVNQWMKKNSIGNAEDLVRLQAKANGTDADKERIQRELDEVKTTAESYRVKAEESARIATQANIRAEAIPHLISVFGSEKVAGMVLNDISSKLSYGDGGKLKFGDSEFSNSIDALKKDYSDLVPKASGTGNTPPSSGGGNGGHANPSQVLFV